jgi:hypothetical protein
VHHINVRIVNVADSIEIYNLPVDAHVSETDGSHSYSDTFILSEDNDVSTHADWRVEAKLWGHDAGEEEETETLQFHVYP